MVLRCALVTILTLLSFPVWAGERAQSVGHDELNFDEPFEQATGKSALRALLNQALDLTENHIQFNGNLQPGSTPFPRTRELRVSPPLAEMPVAAAAGDCASVRCSQRYPLWPRLSFGTAAGSPALA